jgi:hypothetical protein
MTGWRRILVAGETVGRDLLRRRGAVGLLALLPAAFYLAVFQEEIPQGEEPWTLNVGTIGIAWTVAGGAFFMALGSRRVDARLLLAGFRRRELLAGRLLFLLGFAAAIAAAYSVFLALLSGADWWPLALALGATGAVAVTVGLALAALLPRELEGTIALVLVVGVQSSVPASSPVAPLLPFNGPMRLVLVSWTGDGAITSRLAHAGVAAALLLGLATVAWAHTNRVRRPEPARPRPTGG